MVVFRPILFGLALLLAATAAAPAGPLYTAGLTNADSVFGSSNPVTLSSAGTQGSARGNGIVVSSSYLAGALETSATAANVFQSTISYNANASATYDDIFIQGPAGTTVPVTLHVPFDAVFSQHWASVGLTGGVVDTSSVIQGMEVRAGLFGVGFSTAQLEVRNLSDSHDSAEIRTGGIVRPGPVPGTPSSEAHGAITIFRNLPIGDVPGYLFLDRVQSPITVQDTGAGSGVGFARDDVIRFHGEFLLSTMAQVGVPLTLNLTLSLGSNASGSFALGSFGTADALHTFGVPQGGVPVFDLPDGFTANSQSLGIVNNVVPAAESAIPEPGSSVLFLSGTTLLALIAMRKRLAPPPVPGGNIMRTTMGLMLAATLFLLPALSSAIQAGVIQTFAEAVQGSTDDTDGGVGVGTTDYATPFAEPSSAIPGADGLGAAGHRNSLPGSLRMATE
jgi:hypothetical protein